jgi:hypothetical protein
MRRARRDLGADFEDSSKAGTTPSKNLRGAGAGPRRIVILLTREVGAAEPHTSPKAGGCHGFRERWRGSDARSFDGAGRANRTFVRRCRRR